MDEDEKLIGVIHDRYGVEYEIWEYVNRHFWDFILRRGKAQFGYAYCSLSDGLLEIIDICIENEFVKEPWFRWPFFFPPLRWRTENCRNRGLGTALIERVIDEARKKGVRHIKGRLKDLPKEKNKDLRQWYRNCGFSILNEKDDSGETFQMDLYTRQH